MEGANDLPWDQKGLSVGNYKDSIYNELHPRQFSKIFPILIPSTDFFKSIGSHKKYKFMSKSAKRFLKN